jgi:hypothetical protein
MLLILIGLVFFNEGLILMKNLATKDLFKNYYHLEPSMAQKLAVLTAAPSLLKILTGFIIDAKLFAQRKHILMISGTVQFVCYFLLTFIRFDSAYAVTALLACATLSLVFQDTTMESYIVQQARYDPINGQQDLQAYRLIFFGVGLGVGGTVSAFAD